MENKKNIKRVGDYKIHMKLLGSGNFGKVYLAEHINMGSADSAFKNQYLACKVIEKSIFVNKPKLKENLKNEIRIMKTIDHPNVLRIFDI